MKGRSSPILVVVVNANHKSQGTEVYADTKFPPYEFTLVLTEAEYHAGETIAWDVTLVRSDEDNAPERRTPGQIPSGP